jgi:tripartite-type tricarboxylate transporter receptor subunit TctC
MMVWAEGRCSGCSGRHVKPEDRQSEFRICCLDKGTGDASPAAHSLRGAMKQASELPAIKKWFDESGLEVPMSSPEELTSFMRADIEKWVQLAKDNNLKIDMQ